MSEDALTPPSSDETTAQTAADQTDVGEAAVGEDASQEKVLMVMVVSSHATLDDMLTGLLDLAVPGTVLESKGLMAIMRQEMPIFGGLASMLPETTGSRVVISMTTREKAQQVFEFLRKEIAEPDWPVVCTVRMDDAFGLRGL